MKPNTTARILLVSLLVACLMVDEGLGLLQILSNQKNSKMKHKETPVEPSSTVEKHPGSQSTGGMEPLPFGRKRPDRFPEGPMSDKRSRNRFYSY